MRLVLPWRRGSRLVAFPIVCLVVCLAAWCRAARPAGAQGSGSASPPVAGTGGAPYTQQGPKDWYPRLSGLAIRSSGADSILLGGVEYESRTCLVTFFSDAPGDLVQRDLDHFLTDEKQQSESGNSYYLTLKDARLLFAAVDYYNDLPEVRGAALIPIGTGGTVQPPTSLGPVLVGLGGGSGSTGGGQGAPGPVDLPGGVAAPPSGGNGAVAPPTDGSGDGSVTPTDGRTGGSTTPSDGSTGGEVPATPGSTGASTPPAAGGTGAGTPPTAGGTTAPSGGGAGSGVSSPPASLVAESGSLWPGDVNGDYQVTLADVIHILRTAIGLETLTGLAAARADINRSGRIDVGDAILALGLSVGNGLPPPYGYPG